MSAPSRFINLDVVLKSNSDLAALFRHLDQDERVIILTLEEDAGQVLALELGGPMDQVPDVRSYTQRLLTIIDQLPDALLQLWKSCTSRTFSYGFEGGNGDPVLDTTIPVNLLIQIGRIGADIGITVYPHGTYD